MKKLSEKLKDKTVIIYGAGSYFNTINEYYDLSDLNILGISDMKFDDKYPEKYYKEYQVINPENIVKMNPDYILIATRYCFKLGLNLIHKFHNTKTQIKPLVKKGFFELLNGG